MKVPFVALAAALLAFSLAGCGEQAPSGPTRVLLATSMGDMTVELYDAEAPGTVANFKAYVQEGFYSNLTFHRVIAGFMSQTGGFRPDGTQKAPTHPPIDDEAIDSGLKNLRYTLSMARTGRPDPLSPHSATTQFFINAKDNTDLDPKTTDRDDPDRAGYAVFGLVVEGRDVADAINAVPVRACPDRPEASCPTDPPILLSARVL